MAKLVAFNVQIDNKALDRKNLPDKLKVLSWGKNETNDGDVYLNDDSVRVFDAYQRKAGRDKALAIDFDHCTVKGSKEYVPGQPKSIAGYGDPVIVKGDGLYLYNVEWTPMGEKYARNYKDLSPAAVIDKQGVLLGLDSVALTPHGAVRDLNFFSSEGFNETMLKEMAVGDQGPSNPKPTSTGFVIKDSDYNVGGANPAVENGKTVKALDSEDEDDKDEYDEHGVDCKCANCMAAEDPAVHKKHLEEYDSEDHYSKYGDVEYADKENHKYPIDTKAHAKAALAYINMPKNSKKYSGDKLSAIKARIRSAAEKHGVEVADKTTKTMSANNPSLPDAYKAQPNQYNSMNDTIIKKMAAEVGMDGESDSEKVLFAFLAKYEGMKAEIAEQITKKENTEGGGIGKTFSADIEFLKKEIETLKTQKVADTKQYDKTERDQLVRQAAREGKIIPLSADEVQKVDLNILKSILSNQPRNIVPLGSALKVLSVQEENKPSREKAVAAFEAMIVK